jgi:hypothetical protein
MAIQVGPAPWSSGFKRATKKSQQQAGVEWSLSGGYRQKKEGKPEKFKTKQVKLYNGRVVEVPDADFEDFIGHHVSPDSDPLSEIGKYIDKAFENPDRIQDFDGVGHIAYVEYVPTYQLMRVEFTNDGAVVVFFRVPKEVYSELRHLAISKSTMISPVDGTQRHVLGMRFWDIIRIRGQREGSRYRYEYVIHGERTGSAFGKEMEAERTEITEGLSEAAKKIEARETKARGGKTADEELYDRFARNMLTGTKLTEYNKLSTLKQKEAFLHKAGII